MKDFIKKKKLNKMESQVDDKAIGDKDVEEMQSWSEEDFSDPQKVKAQLKKRRKRRKHRDPFVRVDDIERIMQEHGENVDPEKLVSLYIPQRKARRFGNLLLRLDKLKLLIILLLILIAILFIAAFSQEKMGNFTINLDRLQLYRRGINMDYSGNFEQPTARLEANVIQDANNITITDLPANIDNVEGSHNGRNYVAYTYYVRNAGKEKIDYQAVIKLTEAAKGAEYAARVAVYRNGERTVWAEPASDGGAEPGTNAFPSHNVAYKQVVKDFDVGYVDKYTIVIWLEGEDPECVDSIIGGALEFSMYLESVDKDDKSLIKRFIEDIIETIKGSDKQIDVGGTEVPEYYKKEANITWNTRRNK